MADIKILNPDSLGKPLGQYSQITRVKASEFLFIAGQVGASKDGKTPADFDAQCAQTFANIGAALASQGAGFGNIVEFTTYLVHSQDIPKFMTYRTREFPKLFALPDRGQRGGCALIGAGTSRSRTRVKTCVGRTPIAP
jgi:enamine deaminase RidA (YjgF/YER057c/UK114 family)